MTSLNYRYKYGYVRISCISSLVVFFVCLSCLSTALADVIEGTVYEDRGGAPLQSALVRVSGADGLVLKEIESGRDGRFLIEGLDAGEYRLTITKASFMPLEVRCSARPARVQNGSPWPVFRLIHYGVLSGRILPPQDGALTLLERVADGQAPRIFSATANASGDYRFFNIPPGRYVLRFSGTSARTTPRRGLALHPSNDRPREFSFHGGEEYVNVDVFVPEGVAFTVGGRVQSPQARGSYSITLVSTDYPALRLATSRVSAASTFRFEGVLPGTYDLLVSDLAVGRAPALFGRIRVSVTSQDIQDVLLMPEAARSADVTLLSRQELCSSDGTVSLAPLEGWLSAQTTTVPAAGDRPARIEGLAPARYRVTARSRRGDCAGTATLDLRTVAAQTLTLSMTPAGSIRGTVRTEGTPLPVTVVLRAIEGTRESPVQAVLTSTGVSVAFANLQPGRYCIAAYSEVDSMSQWAPESGCVNPAIDLAPGASKSVELKR